MAATIQKSTSGAYFTILNSQGIATGIYPANAIVVTTDSTNLVTITLASGKVILKEFLSNIINGDTSSAFADLPTLTTYVQSNFFRKAGAGAGITSVNGYTTGTIVLTKTDIGLANIDNTSDANKPVSTAQAATLAPIASPTFTGGVALSGNITKAANFGTAGLVFSAPAITVTSTTSTGTIATQGSYAFGIPTLAASSATTLTNASTMYIDGAPTSGTNITVTNPWALYINSGQAWFNNLIVANGGIGTTSTPAGANFYASSGNGPGSTTGSLLQIGGSTTLSYRAAFGGNNSGSALSIGNSYANIVVGSSPITKAASGTHTWLVSTLINPLGTITGSGSTITNTAALYVGAASAAGTNNYSLFVNGLTSTQGLRLTYNPQTANYTALYTDYFIDCTANSFTVTLPLAVGGQVYVITNSGAGTITVQGTSSQLVNGSASVTIAAGATYIIYGTATAWRVKS